MLYPGARAPTTWFYLGSIVLARHGAVYYASPPPSSGPPGVFRAYLYNHARRTHLEKTIILRAF